MTVFLSGIPIAKVPILGVGNIWPVLRSEIPLIKMALILSGVHRAKMSFFRVGYIMQKCLVNATLLEYMRYLYLQCLFLGTGYLQLKCVISIAQIPLFHSTWIHIAKMPLSAWDWLILLGICVNLFQLFVF